MLLLVVVLLLLTITGNFGVEIIVNSPQYQTQCAKDLRNDTDRYILTATYGPNVIVNQVLGWGRTVFLKILTSNSSQFRDICTISLGSSGILCGFSETRLCNCDSLDENGTAHVKADFSAFLNHSAGIVRWEWENNDGSSFHSDNITLPHIYDVKTATLELKVNNQPAVMTSSVCGIFKVNENNTVELCCNDTASPCYPRMSFSDGVVIANQVECVSRTFISVNTKFTVNVTVSYSVCTTNDYITRYSCKIETADAHRKETKSDMLRNILVGVIGGLIGAVLIALVVYLVCKTCASKKQKLATSVQSESRTPDEELARDEVSDEATPRSPQPTKSETSV